MANSPYFEDDSDLNGWEKAEQRAIEAQELYDDGHMQDALAKLDEAVEHNPNCAAWHFNRGLTLDAMGRYEDAIECYQRALGLSPEDLETMNSLAVDYTRTSQYDHAIDLFEQIVTLAPDFEPAYCNRIITYTEMEEYDRAEQMFYLAQQINPECPICFYNIGNSLFTQGRYGRAAWCWEKTAELDPEHPQINYRIAQACWAGKQYDKAKGYFLKELRTNPGNLETLLDYGVFLLESGQIQSADEKFRWVLELNPKFAPAMFYVGEIHRIRERLDEAVECYRKAIELDCNCPGARYRLAQILLYQSQPADVRDLLLMELELDCDDMQVLLSIGNMLVQVEDYSAASECFLQVLDNNPNEGRGYFGLSAVLLHKKDIAGCLQFLEQSVRLDTPILTAYTSVALIYCRQGEYIRALQVLNRARAILGDSWALRRWKAKIRYLQIKQTITGWLRARFGN